MAGSDAATGVAVQLFDGQDTSVQPLPNGSTSAEYNVVNNAVDMRFLAKLVRTAAALNASGVKAGSVSSTVTLYMNYE
ncbi:fimbrial protein [Rahnella sp. AN3-3W3]|uniref:fimbrial protein n=1 Tax=Rahnella sp. AN3-3W3 TaxID=1610578 RepID=UPI0018E4E6EF|nr:type 1 fimbrial protein [Rahnella sp. AN3-3W3]